MNVGSTVGLEMSWCTNGCLLIIFLAGNVVLYCFNLNSCIVRPSSYGLLLKAGKPKENANG
jgi:hypothetical protein